MIKIRNLKPISSPLFTIREIKEIYKLLSLAEAKKMYDNFVNSDELSVTDEELSKIKKVFSFKSDETFSLDDVIKRGGSYATIKEKQNEN